MKSKPLFIVIAFIVCSAIFFAYNVSKIQGKIKQGEPNMYTITINGVELILYFNDNNAIKMMDIHNASNKFSFLYVETDYGDCSYTIVTDMYRETTNTYYKIGADIIMSKGINFGDEINYIQHLNRDGELITEKNFFRKDSEKKTYNTLNGLLE